MFTGREADDRVSLGNELRSEEEDWGTSGACDCAVAISDLKVVNDQTVIM